MSDLDHIKRLLKSRIGTEEETRTWLSSLHPDEQAQPYRLELFYDTGDNVILLQGNERGLRQLLFVVQRLLDENSAAGDHWHFDRATNLSAANAELILQRVDDAGQGTHSSAIIDNE